ncbi:matrix metalloproteinase-15 [Plakobranchus ocellatus]|uniref:Matrix metalloproteinase-15 n=1 Tax=Plakobranchus ocellatus TaxID=259542 RepID=A0AAV3ZGE1_9GAST|nr:matrix metalloproteinase-15 [Plakobranchus ocellatus]
MLPNPIANRCNCWFEAVSNHEKNLQHFATFVAEEMEHCGRMAPDSLVYLNDTLCSESERQLIQAEMSFIVQHSQPIITATDVFQSQRPIAMTAWSKLIEIADQFSSCHVTLQDVERHCLHDLDQHLKFQLQDSFCQAFTLANEKLEKAVFREAFRRWSRPSNIYISETYGEPEIDVDFSSGEHGDGWRNAFDGKGMLLAHAFPPGDVDISGDIHFDSDENWTTGVNNSESRDLMMIAMHEAGHALGLTHSTKRNDIMYPVYLDYNPNPNLSRGDIRQLQKLYGKRPGFIWPRKTWRKNFRRRNRHFRVDKSLPRWCRLKFNAVVLGPDKTGYVFIKKDVYRIDNNGVLPGYPVHVGHEFPGAPINPLTVFYVPETNHFYFYKGNRFWRFTNRTLDKGYPMKSKRPFWRKPTAALSLKDYRGRTMVFFFGGHYTWRWNYFTEEMNGRYHLTSNYWKGLPRRMNSAVEWLDGYVYFFIQNRYYKASKRTKVVLKGYPQFKGSAWLGGACGSKPK